MGDKKRRQTARVLTGTGWLFGFVSLLVGMAGEPSGWFYLGVSAVMLAAGLALSADP